jgi:hypothetical protein
VLSNALFNAIDGAALAEQAVILDTLQPFEIGPGLEDCSKNRQVFLVGWEVDKRYVALPLSGALFLSALLSVAAGCYERSVSTGAQVGGTLCGVVAVVFCYLVWRCTPSESLPMY